MYYALACVIAKDEDETLIPWLLYNFSIGFEHVLIYDNGSSQPIRDLVREFIAAGLVTVIDFPPMPAQQLSAYFHCLTEFRKAAHWIAFIDVDEYIVPKKYSDLPTLLDQYEEFSGLAINWRLFGSNGHISRPSAAPFLAYTRYLKDDTHVKSIVRPSHVTRPLSPHHFAFAPGRYCVNEDRIPVCAAHSYCATESVQINHYYYQSQQDFEKKIARGLVTPVKNVTTLKREAFYQQCRQKGKEDTSACRFQALYSLLAKKSPPAMAAIVRGDRPASAAEAMEQICALIDSQQLHRANLVCQQARRHFDELTLTVVAARLLCLENKVDDGLRLLKRTLLFGTPCEPDHPTPTSAEKDLIYEGLSVAFTCAQNHEKAQAVTHFKDWLKRRATQEDEGYAELADLALRIFLAGDIVAPKK